MNLVMPRAGFLEGLRALCDRHGAVLIFDEVMTGFACTRGACRALTGITPDLTTLGKVIGGGMPVGAFGGRRDDHGKDRAARSRVPGGNAVRQSGRGGGGPRHARGYRSARLLRSARATHARASPTASPRRRSAPASPFCAQAVGGMFGLYFAQRVPDSLRGGDGVRQGALQPLLPRDARCGHLPRAVGVRGGLRVGGARRRTTSPRRFAPRRRPSRA